MARLSRFAVSTLALILMIATLVQSDCVCKQGPIIKGGHNLCEAYMEMYTYNRKNDTCSLFIYGGCNGSENLFNTKEACERRCKKGSKKQG